MDTISFEWCSYGEQVCRKVDTVEAGVHHFCPLLVTLAFPHGLLSDACE
jgi:hypothetical protein